MMRKMTTILATALLSSSLLTAQAEARSGGFGGGQVGGFGGGAQIGGMAGTGGRFDAGRIDQHIDGPHQHLESYPRYLPNGSCIELWYLIPDYRGPEDCS
jgi:hypothetical protein